MINKNFYPTPKGVLDDMFRAFGQNLYLGLRGRTILEPSAGKGDIIDYLEDRTKSLLNIVAMEVEHDLQAILLKKNIRLIGTDFLTDPILYRIDLIVMNPPFDAGAKHLLRAWEVLYEGDIFCLLNAETYNNPYSKERQLLKSIIDEYGEVVSLGQAFKYAERPTNVEVIAVRLSKPMKGNDFDLSDLLKEHYEEVEQTTFTDVEVADEFKRMEARYKATISQFKVTLKEIEKLKFLHNSFKLEIENLHEEEEKKKSKIAIEISNDRLHRLLSKGFNEFIKEFNSDAWMTVLNGSKFNNYLTKKVREDFHQQLKRMSNVAFTKENMMMVLGKLFDDRHSIMDDCILEMFDRFTSYFKENKVHVEGWKTNSQYKCNKKVILPYIIEYTYDGKSFKLKYDSNIEDFDKCMCYLMGKKLEDIVSLKQALETQFKELETGEYTWHKVNKGESTFFKFKFFKKLTLHLEFKEQRAWEWFNIRACELRGHPLPDTEAWKKQNKDYSTKPLMLT